MKPAALALGALGLAAAGGALVIWLGVYDITATNQHLAPTYWLLDTAMRRSVAVRARDIRVPPLDGPARIERGLSHFHRHCVQCHGAPGIAPEPFALGLTPAAANLVHTARTWPPAELFFTVKHGLKMTGMPAWTHRFDDEDLWAIVAFMQVLPTLTPDQYRQRIAAIKPTAPMPGDPAPAGPASVERGSQAVYQYACVTCHDIPGIVGANAPVGPPLAGVTRRAFIAGVLPNSHENLVRWLREPHKISPQSAMPDLGVTARDAEDIVAFLRTLR